MPDHLLMFTVYVRPLDYPDRVVVRPFEIHVAGPRPGEAMLFDYLDEAIVWLASQGLTPLMRDPQDDVSVHSTWL